MKYLNVGCGDRYHPDWDNIDISPRGTNVTAYDITIGLPLADNSYDVVFHSHLLEHIRRERALFFMKECRRVLKPGGILRVVIPDLEKICRLYLESLDAALNGDEIGAYNYEWLMLEFYDQTVREHTGGAMKEYLNRSIIPNEPFVLQRIGEEGRKLISSFREKQNKSGGRTNYEPALSKIMLYLPMYCSRLLNKIRYFALFLFLGSHDLKALDIGRFRLGGEVHHWMYDRYSLANLILASGFNNPFLQSAEKSLVPNWSAFNLDTLADGTVVKPDSLYMEAVKSFVIGNS